MALDQTYTGFAPGRTTLNDHIDYWYGIGIGAALKSGITVNYTPDQAVDSLYIQSENMPGVVARKIADARTEEKKDAWTNYVAGAFNYLQKFGLEGVKGGKVEVTSNIPMGGGVSSSAALIVASMSAAVKPYFKDGELKGKNAAYLLSKPETQKLVENVLANVGDELDANHRTKHEYSQKLNEFFLRLDAETGLKYILALLAHRVETEYVGSSCGRLDQMSCALAAPGEALKINFNDLSFERLPALPEGHELMAIDSGQKHEIADKNGAYFQRFSAPKEAIMPFLGISSILEVQDFEDARDKIQDYFDKAHPEYVAKFDRAYWESPGDDLIAQAIKQSTPNFEEAKKKVEQHFGQPHPEYMDWFEHAYWESKRGEMIAEAIKKGDMNDVADLMKASHTSLSGIYENSTPLIDDLVDHVTAGDGLALAGRIVGGGKGGSIAVLAKSENVGKVIRVVHDYRMNNTAAILAQHSKGISFLEIPPGALEAEGVPASGRSL